MTVDADNISDHSEPADGEAKKSDDTLAPAIRDCDDPEEVLQCRICLAGASIESLTASPCRCSGTMGHLHSSCLSQWLTTRDHHLCEICLYPLRSPRPSDRRNAQSPLVPHSHLLPPVGAGIQPLDPIGMTMDIIAMLVMALGFMYVGYALMQQGPDTVPTEKESTLYANTPAKTSRRPVFSQLSGQQQSKGKHRQNDSTSGMEVTIFCAIALFLILLSTCGNVAIQLLRVPLRRNGNAPPNSAGFSLAPDSGHVV